MRGRLPCQGLVKSHVALLCHDVCVVGDGMSRVG